MSEQSEFPDIFAGQPRTTFTSTIDPYKAKMAPPEWLMWSISVALLIPLLMLTHNRLPQWAMFGLFMLIVIAVHLALSKIYDRRYRLKQAQAPKPELQPPPGENLTLIKDELAIGHWRKFMTPFPEMTWVLFTHGTCVIVPNSISDPNAHAIEHLRLFGMPETGHASADMNIIQPRGLEDTLAVVGCHSPAIFVLVGAIWTLPEHGVALAGHIGRNARQFDAQMLNVIHVEKGGASDAPAA